MDIKEFLKKVYLNKSLDWDALISLVKDSKKVTNASKLELKPTLRKNTYNLYSHNLYLVDYYLSKNEAFFYRIWYGTLIANIHNSYAKHPYTTEDYTLWLDYFDETSQKLNLSQITKDRYSNEGVLGFIRLVILKEYSL